MTFTSAKWPRKLRSQEWFGGTAKDAIYHRGWMKNQGYPDDLSDERPVIGICNTWSDLTPCNGHLRDLAEKVKNGVWEAGGFPVKAGEMTQGEFVEAEQSMSHSAGACNTMGTASTMASMAEALGMAFSGNAAILAVDSRRRMMSQLTGRRGIEVERESH